ncbi:MAG TPA: hypothetical protein O0X73_04910, partial [Methanocorpusculum sp.]|nr:hypothetical protein [Methanocorpusculum sp.]
NNFDLFFQFAAVILELTEADREERESCPESFYMCAYDYEEGSRTPRSVGCMVLLKLADCSIEYLLQKLFGEGVHERVMFALLCIRKKIVENEIGRQIAERLMSVQTAVTGQDDVMGMTWLLACAYFAEFMPEKITVINDLINKMLIDAVYEGVDKLMLTIACQAKDKLLEQNRIGESYDYGDYFELLWRCAENTVTPIGLECLAHIVSLMGPAAQGAISSLLDRTLWRIISMWQEHDENVDRLEYDRICDVLERQARREDVRIGEERIKCLIQECPMVELLVLLFGTVQAEMGKPEFNADDVMTAVLKREDMDQFDVFLPELAHLVMTYLTVPHNLEAMPDLVGHLRTWLVGDMVEGSLYEEDMTGLSKMFSGLMLSGLLDRGMANQVFAWAQQMPTNRKPQFREMLEFAAVELLLSFVVCGYGNALGPNIVAAWEHQVRNGRHSTRYFITLSCLAAQRLNLSEAPFITELQQGRFPLDENFRSQWYCYLYWNEEEGLKLLEKFFSE